MNYKHLNEKYKSEYAHFDQLTATTVNEMYQQLYEDEDGTIQKIMKRNMLSAHKRKNLFDDARQHLFEILLKYKERDGEKKHLDFYNRKKDFRYWLTRICQFQFKSDNSDFFRNYYHNKSFKIEYSDTLEQHHSLPEKEETKDLIDLYSGFEFISEMGTLLYSQKAKDQFHQEEIDLFYFYITRMKKRKMSLKKIADESNLSFSIIQMIIRGVKEFVRQEMEK